MYCIIVFIARDNKDHPWHKYCSKNGGRERFQKDLAQELIAYAIHVNWRKSREHEKKFVRTVIQYNSLITSLKLVPAGFNVAHC
jgi:hypothetical protein